MHFIRVRNILINLDNVNHIAKTKKKIDIVFANNDWLGMEVGLNITQKDYNEIVECVRKSIPVEKEIGQDSQPGEESLVSVEIEKGTVQDDESKRGYGHGSADGERQ